MEMIASTTCTPRKPVGVWPGPHDRESAAMFLIRTTQMIHDQTAKATSNQEARRESCMASRLLAASRTAAPGAVRPSGPGYQAPISLPRPPRPSSGAASRSSVRAAVQADSPSNSWKVRLSQISTATGTPKAPYSDLLATPPK
jgi:hypothetical protein